MESHERESNEGLGISGSTHQEMLHEKLSSINSPVDSAQSPSFSSSTAARTPHHSHSQWDPTAEETDEYWPGGDKEKASALSPPSLAHTWRCDHSILSLVTTDDWIIAGTGNGDILMFNKKTFAREFLLQGHTGSVYSLELTPDGYVLFSGAADSLVKAWDLRTRKELFTIYSVYDIGDIFTIAWAPNHEYLFLGAQNASIQWIQLYEKTSYHATQDPRGLPARRFDRFFDSKGPGGQMCPLQQQSATPKQLRPNPNANLLEIPPKNIITYAHNSYVYSLLVIKRTICRAPQKGEEEREEELLVSGGGDGIVKIWNFNSQNGTIEALYTLDTDSSVFSMCCQDSFLYCGLSAGQVSVFDLDTRQLIRMDKIGDDDVMALSLYGECVFRGGNGFVRQWDAKLYHRGQWLAHNGHVLATALTGSNGRKFLVTGGNDAAVSIWDVTPTISQSSAAAGTNNKSIKNDFSNRKLWAASFNSTTCISFFNQYHNNSDGGKEGPTSTANKDISATLGENDDNNDKTQFSLDHMIQTLRSFVGYKTVSGHGGMYISDCRRCATFLRSILRHFGADSQLIPVENGGNPIVYAKFSANAKVSDADGDGDDNDDAGVNADVNAAADANADADADADADAKKRPQKKRPSRILFYGHYDVIIADKIDQWETDPFELTNLDGYMYGRGVSDNKGPILAAIFAVAELVQSGTLQNDITFLLEGEEECGSPGFQSAVTKHQSTGLIDPNIDLILLSNSYWLDDETPCLNYGLRGIIKATVEIKGKFPDLHSGVYGGMSYREPTLDLVNLLSKLSSDEGRIMVPGFHDSVRPVDDEERKLYKAILERPFVTANAGGSSSTPTTAATAMGMDQESLMNRWRFPSLTIHKIKVSGPGNSTLIPQTAIATISVRIVPDQDLAVIKQSLNDYLYAEFAKLQPPSSSSTTTNTTKNTLTITIFHEAEPWVGSPSNPCFTLLHDIVASEWKKKPLFIREGGSIPAVRFLERVFGAPAAQLPCGQASDGAHLDNERLRVLNFGKTRDILRRMFSEF